MPGVTGTGKSTQFCHHTIAEVRAGRGVALLDCQGDLVRLVLDRLPASAGRRLVILDPDEADAPPALNPLEVDNRADAELVAENVVGVFRKLYASHWGPRMDDTLRAACLTLVQRPGSTLADVVPLLSDTGFRRRLLANHGEPDGLAGFWDEFNDLTPAGRAQACGPVVSRLRGVFTRQFARDVLAAPVSTFRLADILDGGILLARLPKGELGEDCSQLVGSLLLAGLWQAITYRAHRQRDQRPDATIIVDECHNYLNLPIGIEDALAESRGYRVSWLLAHQNLTQLTPETREGIDANCRNKVFFTLSPADAVRLVRHVAPYFEERDLAHRTAFQMTCRVLHHGSELPAFTVDAPDETRPILGRAELLRAAARQRTGLPRAARVTVSKRRAFAATPGSEALLPPAGALGGGPGARGGAAGQSPRQSPRHRVRQSPRHLEPGSGWRTRPRMNPQVNPTEEES
jgi:hypothetical protein